MAYWILGDRVVGIVVEKVGLEGRNRATAAQDWHFGNDKLVLK